MIKDIEMRFANFIFLFPLFYFNGIFAQNDLSIKLPSEILNSPKHYVVSKTHVAPVIDGIDSDECWSRASFSDLFIDIEGKKAADKDTKVKLLWNEEFLFLFAVLEEDHIWGDISKRDEIIYFNNDFEIFIDPEGKGAPYGEIEINALGTEWDLLLTKAYRAGGKAVFNWNIEGLKSAVHIDGSLNDPSDSDKSWSVEMAIPIHSLTELITRKKPFPRVGEVWRINFSRVQWKHDIIEGEYHKKKIDGRYLAEQNWVWSPQYRIDMHMPEKWGYLHFSENGELDRQKKLKVESPEEVKILYALYHKIAKEEFCVTEDLLPGSTVKIWIDIEKTERIFATYIKTYTGFELLIEDYERAQYSINQEGKIQVRK